jgi:hypothetical protein
MSFLLRRAGGLGQVTHELRFRNKGTNITKVYECECGHENVNAHVNMCGVRMCVSMRACVDTCTCEYTEKICTNVRMCV